MNDRNLDYPQPMQGYMAKQILAQVQADAHALEAQLRDNDRIPAWTLTKLATGGDRIGMAARYLLHKMQSPPAYGDAAAAAATIASVQGADKRASAARAAGWIVAALVATHLLGAVASPRRAR